MAKTLMIVCLAASLILAAFVPLGAQTSAQDQQKAMEAYMKAGAVTENHAYLKRFVGSWTWDTKQELFRAKQEWSLSKTLLASGC